jgi:hypothetical protein
LQRIDFSSRNTLDDPSGNAGQFSVFVDFDIDKPQTIGVYEFFSEFAKGLVGHNWGSVVDGQSELLGASDR